MEQKVNLAKEDTGKEIEHDDANKENNNVIGEVLFVVLFAIFGIVSAVGTKNVVNESVENRVVQMSADENEGTQGEGVTKIYVDTEGKVE